jgi:hypothetical protein
MNLRRGLWRLWIIASCVFVICVFVGSYRLLREDFRIANTDYDAIAKDLGGYSLLPTDCEQARGTVGSDYSEMQISAGIRWRISGDSTLNIRI